MPKHETIWYWDEAFNKFGFGDGDGLNFTDDVAMFIHRLGYECVCETWGMHNYMIMDIKKDGISIIPEDVNVGYDDPKCWMHKDLYEALEKEFGEASS